MDPNNFNSQSDENIHYNQHSHDDFLCHLNQDQLKLSLPLPNFLIDPKDGQFTPYSDRSPASTPDQEYDDPMDFHTTSLNSSPLTSISPVRSRATSIALQKMIENQAQMFLDISTAWKKKYSLKRSSRLTGDAPPPASRKPLGAIQELANSPQVSGSFVRKMRSLSLKSSPSLSSLAERLSLDADAKIPVKVDVDSWKTLAIESKEKEASTRLWIDRLPVSEGFEQFPDDEPSPVDQC